MSIKNDKVARRSLLKGIASTGMLSAMAEFAHGRVVHEVVPATQEPAATHNIKFSVIGLDHGHINSMTAAMIRGGGQLVAFHGTPPAAVANFQKRYPQAKQVKSEDEIINDPSIQLIACASIPDLRAAIGIRAMKQGKDFLVDKPGVTTLEQLAEVRKTIAATKKKFAIMYSERLEVKAGVKAGELIHAGEIGKVVQVVSLAPHKCNPASRPEWFWHKKRFGGILCDIASHSADQFVYYTGATKADVTAAQVANVKYKQYPEFEDFGDMMVHGNGGAGYIRVDWFTPDKFPVFGDGRLFVLGTEGYIEARKYIDLAGRPAGNHLFLVNQKETRYIDCANVPLPFGPQFVADIVNRTQIGQNQEQCLLATELVLKAQKQAKVLSI